jgi:fatty-acyl-CoA synthase
MLGIDRVPRLVDQLVEQVRSLPVTAQQAWVLRRSGLAPLTHPDEIAYALLAVRRWGIVAGALKLAARRDPAGLGLVDELGELTFADLDRRSDALASAWRSRGLGSSSTIAVLCRDHRGLIEAMVAAGKLGAKVLLLNTGFAGPQLAAVADREGVDALVHDQGFTDLVGDVPPSVPRFLGWTDGGSGPDRLEDLIGSTPASPVPAPERPGALVLLTSGTTGTPKGAARQITNPFVAAQFLDRIPLRPRQRTVFGAPLFHATGFSQFVLTLALGSATILRRRFDPEAVLRLVGRYRAEALVVVPTMLQRIVALPDEEIRRHDTSRLRVLFCAGSALPPEVGNRALELFGDVLYNLYGSTEVAVASVATPQDWRAAPGTVGRPPVGCRVLLLDDDGARVTAPGAIGRIFVGSDLQFAGYTGGGGKDEVDGLLASGDVGHVDEHGLLFVDGRDDDMIVSGGENVFPAEVENTLLQHPGIADAAVIGVADVDFGQRLRAFVVPAGDAALSADDVKAHVRSMLARHKVPRDVVFRDALPRNATGKVVRSELPSGELD